MRSYPRPLTLLSNMPLNEQLLSRPITATFRRTDGFFMRRGGARRALYQYLQYDSAIPQPLPCANPASTLRIICFAGCTLRDLRSLLAPFGITLRPDGTGDGVTPAGFVACVATSLGGPRPVLVFWKKTAVEQMLLAGVLKKQNGHLGILPVPVFREVLWPWVKLAVRGDQQHSTAYHIASTTNARYQYLTRTPQPPPDSPFLNHIPDNNGVIMEEAAAFGDSDDDYNSEIDEDELLSGVQYAALHAPGAQQEFQEPQADNEI